MRLSDVKGERTLDVIAALVVPVSNIMSDDSALALFRGGAPAEGQSNSEALLERLKTAVPAILNGHRSDVVSILSAIEGTAPEEYVEGLSLAKLMADLYDLITDEEFLSFLQR